MNRDLTLAGVTALVMLAATHSLSRVFSVGTWRPAVLLAIALPLSIAVAVRILRLHVLLTVALGAVAFVAYLDVQHLPPGGGLLPSSVEWHQFTTLFSEGLTQVQQELAPVLPFPGLVLIASSGTFLVTLLVHELLVRYRKAGLALLPAAVLWTVPLAVPQPPGRTWPYALPFLAASGLVLLLESDADVAGWYREAASRRVNQAGLLVGVAALAVAAVAPGLLPGYQADPWYDQVTSGGPPGYQPLVDVGDRLKLPEARDVLEVTSDRPLYLRIAALDTFDGRSWRIGPAGVMSFSPSEADLTPGDETFPPEVPLGPIQQIGAQVRVLDLRNIYVPVPYQPRRITGPNADEMVYSRIGGFVATVELEDAGEINGRPVAGVVQGLEYGVVAELPAPTPEQALAARIDPDQVAPHLQLPPGFDPQPFAELAHAAYEARGAQTPIERAFALQDFFIGEGSEYTYSTGVDSLLAERGQDAALQRFLFEAKSGYCEYYATAMAVMLRATGIPARVAVGFLPGDEVTPPVDPASPAPPTGAPRTFRVSTDDAHAWVEVLQPGIGWLKFDPTPRSDGSTMPPTTDDLDPLLTLAERAQLEPEAPTQPTPAPPLPGSEDIPDPAGPDREPTSVGGTGSEGSRLPWVLTALALVAGVGGAALYQWRSSPHGPVLPATQRVLAAQRRVHRTARRYGLPRHPAETPAELASRWTREARVEDAVAARFTQLVHEAAFSGEVDERAGAEADALADRLVASLRESVPAKERALAPMRGPVDAARQTGTAVLTRVRRGD